MKKLLLFIFLILSFNLFSMDISFEGDFPLHVQNAIEKALVANTEGRGNVDYKVSSYSEIREYSLSGSVVYFTVSYGGKDYPVTALHQDGTSYEASIYDAIENLLYYEPLLQQEGGISYIFKNNYSVGHSDGNKKGTTVKAVDLSGNVRGVFELKDSYEGYDVLRPLYLDRVLPGLKTENISSSRYALTIASSLKFDNFSFWGEYGYTSLIYPMIVKGGMGASISKGSAYVFGAVGLEGYFYLNSALPSVGFTLIEEGRIGANAFLTTGVDKGFRLDSLYSVFYEHRATPYLMWRIGYSVLPGAKAGISLSIGGSF